MWGVSSTMSVASAFSAREVMRVCAPQSSTMYASFLRGQVRVDHRVVEARALEPERHLVGAVVVEHERGDVVPLAEAVRVEGLRQAAAPLLELGERDDLRRVGGRDHRRAPGVGGDVGGGAESCRGGVGAHGLIF